MILKYTKIVSLSQLRTEITQSEISIAIKSMAVEDSTVIIEFKVAITKKEALILDGILDAHVPLPVTETPVIVELGSSKTITDSIPYVYATSKPLDHYVCFQGAGDLQTGGIGAGEKLVWYLTSTMSNNVKSFTFNEDVYMKDGYIITKDAPFGASIDIDVIHPFTLKKIYSFGKEIPVFGSGWFTLDTEDRAFLPRGLIIRITVHNSTGGTEEDAPATFRVAGRIELYRPLPNGMKQA